MTPPSTDNPESPSHAPETPALTLPLAERGGGNRKVATSPSHTRAYPWLLVASTAMAALFCFMYITKPVLPLAPPLAGTPGSSTAGPHMPQTSPATDQPLTLPEKSSPVQPLTDLKNSATAQTPAALEKPVTPLADMLPNPERLPGDTHAAPAAAPPTQADSPRVQPAPPPVPTFEETNLQIQHVLTATTPGGDISRIVLNVPVLYQSRNLGWTDNEVAESRELLKRLTTYQENSRALREEGSQLLAAWNHLIERSIPTPVLRADSPSLPANQDHAIRVKQPAGLDTTESIQIQPADK